MNQIQIRMKSPLTTQDGNPNMTNDAEENETLRNYKAKIRTAVAEAMTLSKSEKKECIRRLYRTWHPDKNPHQSSHSSVSISYGRN